MTRQAAAELLVHSSKVPAIDGLVISVTPQSAGWAYVGFEVYRLKPGADLRPRMDGRELCAVILSGSVDVDDGRKKRQRLGSRATVFDGPPDALYMPPDEEASFAAVGGGAEIAMCWAPASRGVERQVIRGDDVHVYQRGSERTERTIRDVLMMDRPAESLLVTEVITPGGNWSSYPPHKHDTDDPPRESYLEETYYHRTRRPSGFAMQRVYTSDGSLDVSVTVHDGDVVLVPRGYHPVTAEPGCDLYYLNVMAGPRRQWLVTLELR